MSDPDNLTTTRNVQDKKSLKIAYLESENRNLEQMNEDLQVTLGINKNIIRNLLDSAKKGALDYTVS